jgi:hypothetical protein
MLHSLTGGSGAIEAVNSLPTKKASALKNRWRHQAPVTDIHSQLTEPDLDVLLHYGTTQQLETVMDPFWRSLCECKLLPLTTDYYPCEKEIKNTQRYHNELSQVNSSRTGFIRSIDDYLNEYICLRLTQNFQLINVNPTCNVDFQGLLQRRNDIKMGMGNKYNILTAQDRENF